MLYPATELLVGSDPEIFFKRDGAIIGSEKVVPERGLISKGFLKPDIVLDGVQVELNPAAGGSIAALGGNIAKALSTLKAHLRAASDVEVCFTSVVDVTQAELNSLSEKSRRFGCAPSKNVYGKQPEIVNAASYLKRSAGGHLHFGLGLPIYSKKKPRVDERFRLVCPLDLIVGNTGVLLDRDPGAAERRKYYGRAGEHRLPKHGLEYRTLSNFWLRAYPLFDLMAGLGKMAISVIHTTLSTQQDLEMDLMSGVDLPKVVKAINTNDIELARENFEHVKRFVLGHCRGKEWPITSSNIDKFEKFLNGVQTKGLEAFFPDNPLEHWTGESKQGWTEWLEQL